MSAGISRRALLRAFVDARESGSPAIEDDAATVRIARIGADCVEPKGVSCRRCGEVCDENAIRFVPLPAGRAMPVLDPVMCSGCGECLAPCPVHAISLVASVSSLTPPADAPEAHP